MDESVWYSQAFASRNYSTVECRHELPVALARDLVHTPYDVLLLSLCQHIDRRQEEGYKRGTPSDRLVDSRQTFGVSH
jgi:hypothetical protein